jgi:ATP-dependent exoDNAse (exonuclease V) beta subunit
MFFPIKPKLITIDRKRQYCFEGQIYPSVTSILSATKPEQAKQALHNWRRRIGKEKAQQITTNASRRGTSLHAAIATLLKQQPVPEDIEDNRYWHSILPVLEKVERIHLIESAIYHSECKYAGIYDCLGEWEGQLCLFDWKTASQPKRLEWIEDYCLQVAAYIAAIEHLYQVNITQGIIAIALFDRPAQIFYLNENILDNYWQQFLERLKLFYLLI